MAQATSRKGSYEDYINGKTSGKIFHFELTKKNLTPSMFNSKGEPIVYVGHFSMEAYNVISEKNSRTGQFESRVIRLAAGEKSIYKDEQSDDKDVPKKKVNIVFARGKRVVNTDYDPQILDFLMKCNENESNPNRKTRGTDGQMILTKFKLQDNSKAIEKSNSDIDAKYDAVDFARKGVFDEVEALALVMGVNMNQTVDEIRYDMRQIAERDPHTMLRMMKDPMVRKKFYVMTAINEGYLVIDANNNTIAWKTNPGQPLDVAATGKSVIDSFVKLLSTDAGRTTYEAIVELVTPESVINAVDVKIAPPSKAAFEAMKAEKNPVVNHNEEIGKSKVNETDEELSALFESAVSLKIITYSPPMWFTYDDGVNMPHKFKKKEGFIEKARLSQSLVDGLKFKVEEAVLKGQA